MQNLFKKMKITKKRIVLFSLFILPLFLYLMLSSGINNFAKLPVVTKNVLDISLLDNKETLKNNISIVCFLGDDLQNLKGGIFNLNQKIYKPFYGFKDFQVIAIYPKGKEKEVAEIKKQLGAFTDMIKWKFIPGSKEEIEVFYNSLKTNKPLENLYSQNAFIVDREMGLRGRTDDEDSKDGKLFGYNMSSVAELNNKMKDDLKVVLAEYRLALKKNNADREI